MRKTDICKDHYLSELVLIDMFEVGLHAYCSHDQMPPFPSFNI